MGRLLVLAVLLGVMFVLRTLAGGTQGAHDPLILAAIGFVVMASYTAAEIGSLVKLPRVSGYIAAGILLGPYLGNILSTGIVEDMTMFNELALGLIALGAGLELDIGAQKKLWRTLAATVGAKVVLAGGAVTAGFIALQSIWHPLPLDTSAQVISVALVLGTLSIGTSPAITLAVITETQARGRLADLSLGAAVLKDLVLVVLLAIVLATGTGMLGTADGHGSIGALLALELGGSVVTGGALGLLILAYVRFVREEMLLFVVGLVLAAAELGRALHLDLLLVFIAAGFVVRNVSKQWEHVLHAIETVSLPVFVIYFTSAGARIDLDATITLLPFALALSGLRAGAFYVSARLGARAGREDENVRRLAWQAYLPQAGVTLTLLGVAAEALDPVRTPLLNIGIACVAVNLAVGPVTLRRALQFAGVSERPSRPAPRPSSAPPTPSQAPLPPLVIDSGAPEIDRPLSALREEMRRVTADVVRDHLRPHVQAFMQTLKAVFAEEDQHGLVQRLHSWALERHAGHVAERARDAARALHAQVLATLEQVPPQREVPLAPELLQPGPKDGPRLRFAKLRLRLRQRLSRRSRIRRVPLRTAARVALAPRAAALAEQLQASICRTHGKVLVELRRAAAGDLSVESARDAVTQHMANLERDFHSDAGVAISSGLRDILRVAADIDSPARPLSSLRYSAVEPEVRARIGALGSAADGFAALLSAAEQAVVRDTALRRLRESAELSLEQQVLLPLAEAADALEPAVAQTKNRLREALESVRKSSRGPDVYSELQASFESALAQRERSQSARGDRFRAAAALHAASTELRSLVDAVPDELSLLWGNEEAHEIVNPARAVIRVVRPRTDARRELLEEFLPTLDLESRRATAAVQDLDARVSEALEMASSVTRAAGEGDIQADAVDNSLELALTNLAQGTEHARKQLIAAHEAISAAFSAAFERLLGPRTGPLELSAARSALTRPIARWLSAAVARTRSLIERVRQAARWALGTELAQRFKNRLDTPQDLRALLSRQVADALPSSYARLFRLEPEQDLRHCIAREKEHQQIADAQTRWKAGGHGSVLIAGEPGSGRTTLINSVQREIVAARLLRPESARSRRKEGLTRALAYELGCAALRRELLSALREEPTAVLVDDLEHWFTPDAGGLAQLRSFLDLVRSTRSEVFWVVSISTPMLELARGTITIEDVFGDVVRLRPFTRAQLRRAIEVRHSLSGLTLVYPGAPFALADRLFRHSEGELVFRVLHTVSGGNPATALSLWQNSVRVEGKQVHVLLDQLLSQRLPHLLSFDAETIALLVQLHRFGPMSAPRLAASLGVPLAKVRGSLVRLEDAGLLSPSAGTEVTLASEWRGVLAARLPVSTEWRG